MATQRLQRIPETIRNADSILSPATVDEMEDVRQQLERILSSPVFRNSKRYGAVLRFIVERTLDGTADDLKERTIGIEVFGREPSYDTAVDHVVRSAASEIRKRLAQYYQTEGTGGELRIELQPGSYVPLFRLVPVDGSLTFANPVEPVDAFPGIPPAKKGFAWKRVAILAGTLMAAAVAVAFATLSALKPGDPLETFWRPILSSREKAVLCVGNLEGGHMAVGEPTDPMPPVTLKDFHNSDTELVHAYDAMTLARIAGLLQSRGESYRLLSQSEATFTDLQNGPAVLVGFNNDWTGRLFSSVRFTVELGELGRVIIRDRDHPLNNDWSVDYSTPYLKLTKDFAIVLRETDPKTERTVVAIAGMSAFGTLAAGEFLTDAAEMKKLTAIAPRGWERKNMEVVLSTDIIKGKPGRANVIALYLW